MSKIRIVAPNGDAKRLLVWVNGVDVSRMATVLQVEPEVVISFVPDRVIMDEATKVAVDAEMNYVVGLLDKSQLTEADFKDPAPVAETVGNAPANEPAAYGFDVSEFENSNDQESLRGDESDST